MKVAGITWQDRIERVHFLASLQDVVDDVLLFYAKILRFQEGVQTRLGASAGNASELVPFVPELMELMAHSGTSQMKEFAASCISLDWDRELTSYWNDRGNRPYGPLSFISLALLQPFARNLAARAQVTGQVAPHCPFCFRKPQLGVLRPEGEGGKLNLLCTFCGTEWEFRRIICSNCEESDKEKLPVYKSDTIQHIKLAACDNCHTYLKCVDLSIDGRAIPEVDDVASLPMSLWMAQNGFQPLQLNLFGF